MKRIIALLSALAVSVSLFAGFTFSFGPFDPLYPGADTDPNGMNSGLHYIHQLSSSPEGNNMLVRWKDRNPSDENYFEVIDFREWKDKFNNYIHLQAATDASILRMGFKDIFMLDATIQAGLNTVFAATGGADNLGMDGTFFVGAEAELLNTVAFRFGMRHYSGHVGDEIIMNAMDYTNENSFDAVQYTRDNYLEAGIGFRIRDYVKGGVSLMMPKKNSWWDPIFHIPNYIEPLPGQSYADREPDEWAVRGDYDERYKAYIIMADIEARWPINDAFAIRGGFNYKLHQDGITNHTLTPDDDSMKWEAEYTAALALDFDNAIDNKTLSMEFIYHNGRFPLLNYFWKRSSYVSIGFAVR